MELVEGCHLVASGRLGFGITSPWDCHAYLVAAQGDGILVDTGCGRDLAAVIANIDAALNGGRRLVAIVLTHGHVDHSGGAAGLSAHYDAPVYGAAEGLQALRTGDEQRIGLARARVEGVYPADQAMTPVPDALAVPGDGIVFGDRQLQPLATPGHSYDHMAYVCELPSGRAVFSGDLVFADGRVAILDTPDTDLAAYAASLHRVRARAPEMLLPGHGGIVRQDAARHVQTAVDAFDRGELPEGLPI